MQDSEILNLYNRFFAEARQSGGQRETPYQIAHASALRKLLSLSGDGEVVTTLIESSGSRLPNEDHMEGHQRRLGLAQLWLNQSGRRQRYAVQTTFTDIIDAFAAGGAFERQFFEKGIKEIGELAELRLKETEHEITQALEHLEKVDALFEHLMEVTQATSVEEMVAKVQRLVVENSPDVPDTERSPARLRQPRKKGEG